MTSFTPRKPRSASERRNAVQNGSASDAPVATPSTSRRPSVFTPTAIITATETIRDRVHPAALMGGMEDLRGRGPEPLVVISDDQLHAPQAPIRQRAQKRRPERFGFRRAGGHAQHLAPPIRVHANSDYHSDRDDP